MFGIRGLEFDCLLEVSGRFGEVAVLSKRDAQIAYAFDVPGISCQVAAKSGDGEREVLSGFASALQGFEGDGYIEIKRRGIVSRLQPFVRSNGGF